MKTLSIILRVVLCLVLAGVAYFWATSLMDSMFAYRSPLRDSPPAPGEALAAPGSERASERVVFVLVDALREDTSLKTEVMPFLNGLRAQSAWATMHSRPPSYSEPGYTVLLTGAWPDISDGPPINLDYEEIPTWTQDNLFSAAHRAGLKTAISGYYWFEKLVPQEAVDASFYTIGEDDAADRDVLDAALPWLEEARYNLVLIHIDQVDYAGHHEGGPQDPRWDQAAARADAMIEEIANQLDFSRDTLVVLSDHGQIDKGGHGGQEAITLVEPFVMVGAGVKPGQYEDMHMVDVAPTLAALLGANLPASTQGRVLSEMLSLPPETAAALPAATEQQQKHLLEAYTKAIGKPPPEAGADTVAAYQAALEKARSGRLVGERLPRALLASVVVGGSLAWLVIKQKAALPWLFGGALLYLAIFNLRYAVLDGRTYSLSSVYSADSLILYCAITAAVGLLISWLVAMFGSKAFKKSPGDAARWALDLTLVTVFLLGLFVLTSYTLNGILVTWALPQFLSMFLGFLSLIQILIVAVVGLLLGGITALWARFTPQK